MNLYALYWELFRNHLQGVNIRYNLYKCPPHTINFHFWGLHPVVSITNNLWGCHQSITTVFFLNVFIAISYPLQVSTPYGPSSGGIYTSLFLGIMYTTTDLFLPCYQLRVELSLYYGRRSVDQFVLVSDSPLGPMTRFYPFFSLVTFVLMFFLLGALSDERTVCRLECLHSLVRSLNDQ
jgi:hypothetical protein